MGRIISFFAIGRETEGMLRVTDRVQLAAMSNDGVTKADTPPPGTHLVFLSIGGLRRISSLE